MEQALTPPDTLLEAIRYFGDPDRCLAFLVAMRWPDGVACPTCGSREVSFLSSRRLWECKGKHARKQFSAKVGTIMEDSAIGLDKWLPAIWLAANPDNAVSSHELARTLGTTQKSAWFMLHRIEEAEATRDAAPIAVEAPVEEDAPAGTDRRLLALVAAGFFALGAFVGWLAGRAERRRKRRR